MFYPRAKQALVTIIQKCFSSPLGPGLLPRENTRKPLDRVECLIVPHAGYEYSGPIASHSYHVASDFFNANDSKNTTVIILGPNHYGLGSGVALSPSDKWATPLGDVNVRIEMSKKLSRNCNILDFDELAHSKEHSIEVQLPFLQIVSRKEASWGIIPISMMLQDIETARQIAQSITELIEDSKDEKFLVLGSSDLTHYEAEERAREKDCKLLDTVAKMNLLEYYNVLERLSVSACGYGAIATVIEVAKKLRRSTGVVLKYATSGDVSGDKSSVVGYSSVRFI